MLEVTVDGSQGLRIANALQRLPRRLTRNLAEVLREGARDTARGTRHRLRARRFPPAAPRGEAPARRTGELARNIRFRAARRDRLAYVVEARAQDGSAFYARILEAKGWPVISAELDAQRARLQRRLVAAIEETLEGVNRSF